MDFPEYNFETLNETDVREEIVAPLLRHLKYRSGTKNNIIREQSLSYSKLSLGRKKNTDPFLRGKADYICEAENKVRWVIEAKSPMVEIDNDSIEQAWTYANHPEIRAVYHCLTNGRKFKVFQTNNGPDSSPTLEWDYSNMEEMMVTIENLLSPEAIIKNHPTPEIDTGKPLGLGLRSIVRVTSGFIHFTKNSLNIPAFNEMIMTVVNGSIERNEYGKIVTYFETVVPFQSLQELNERLGLHSMILVSEDETISSDPEKPSTFKSFSSHILPKGEEILDLNTWKKIELPFNIPVKTETYGIGILTGHVFSGKFNALLDYPSTGLKYKLEGVFLANLS